jgi:Ase1/PRC1/MAP65 family protein
MFGLQSWEKKKVQSQVVFERDNAYASRPSTSSRRLPNRSLNGSLDYSPHMNKRLPMGIQQLGSNNINSGNQGISFIKDGRKIQRKKIFDEPTFTFHMQDEASSIMSTHSGPFSP